MSNIDKAAKLRELQDIATERGGYCLSFRYVNTRTKLRFICSNGHDDWTALPKSIQLGTWCQDCHNEATLEEMQNIAAARGGYCLSFRYMNAKTALHWMCSEGHIWPAIPNRVKNAGNWCQQCYFDSLKGREPLQPLTLEEMQDIAATHGGYCLSSTYINSQTPLHWMCGQGHIWPTSASSVKYAGTWCPICANDSKRLTLEEMQDIAAVRGGYCLSFRYVDNKTTLHWMCSEGHIWPASPNHVKNSDNWCPACQKESERLTLEEMQDIATARGGYCLSFRYVNAQTPLHWMCSEGHIWPAVPKSVKNLGTWCGTCLRLTLREMQDIAAARGGYCLSFRYVNIRTPLRWMCSEGHIWSTAPGSVKHRKSWCPICNP